MSKFKSSSIWSKIALGCLSLANVISLIAYFTTSWRVVGKRIEHGKVYEVNINEGIWQVCTAVNSCLSYGEYGMENPVWRQVVKALTTAGVVCLLAAVAFLLLYIFLSGYTKKKVILLMWLLLAFHAALFYLAGVTVFGAMTQSTLTEVGFSLYLAVVASLFSIAAFVCGLFDINNVVYYV